MRATRRMVERGVRADHEPVNDTVEMAIVCGCSIVGMSTPLVLLAVVKLGPNLKAKRNAARLSQLAPDLGLTPEAKTFRVSWVDPDRTQTVFSRELDGRKVTVHYQSYFPLISLVRQMFCPLRLPVSETWVHASIWPTLALGADEPTDPLSIRRGLGPGSAGASLTLAFANKSRQLMACRGQAALRLMTLLDHPSIESLAGNLGPHVRCGSDDEVLLVLDGFADGPRIRRACVVATQMAAVLPDLRRRLPATPLDDEVARLAAETERFVQREQTDLPVVFGVCAGTYVTLGICLDVPLEGIGSFTPSASGLTHRVGHSPAPLPAPFNDPAVVGALESFRNLPGLVGIDRRDLTIWFIAETGSSYGPLVSLAFRLATALRDTAARPDGHI